MHTCICRLHMHGTCIYVYMYTCMRKSHTPMAADLLEGNGGEAEDLASGSTSEGALTDGEDGGDALTDGEDGGDGLTDGEDGGDGHPEALVNKVRW